MSSVFQAIDSEPNNFKTISELNNYCYTAVRICIWSTNRAVFKYLLNVPNGIDIALTLMWLGREFQVTGPEKWNPLIPTVLVCVFGTTSCPVDSNLSCERPWTADTEFNRLFKYSDASACWHLEQSTRGSSTNVDCSPWGRSHWNYLVSSG